MNLEEQQRYTEQHAMRAFARTIRFMKDHRAEILALMLERLEAGHDAKADESWKAPHDALTRAQLEDAADLTLRSCFKMRQGWPA